MKNHIDNQQDSVTVVGAGLTGLTTAFWLARRGISVHVVERQPRIGGQIDTQHKGNYIFETGPTTGSVATPEVAELMMQLEETSHGACRIETAPDAAKKRLIWKGDRFHALPSGLLSAIATPLFTPFDKLRILGEPWRQRGSDANESVGQLARRRLGASFVDYAVDPFISGVYAGNPDTLVTRYALPKLYALERDYGSFVRGAIAKARQPKTERERLATKRVFSAFGGLSNIIRAEADCIGRQHITAGAADVMAMPTEKGWLTTWRDADGSEHRRESRWVVTTCGAYALPQVLPFVDARRMAAIGQLDYAPVMEVNVGMSDTWGGDYMAFGGLVPSVERRDVLGILFPSACFAQRTPQGGVLFAFFIGGSRRRDLMERSDAEIERLVTDALHTMLKFPHEAKPDFIHISRHARAIPQYDASTGARLEAVESLQREYRGLVVGGNLRDGIGMAHRITQAARIVEEIAREREN